MAVAFSYTSATAIASGVSIEQEAIRSGLGSLRIPQKIALFGQYNAGKTVTNYTPRLISSPAEAASIYGVGSMLHRMAEQCAKGKGSVEMYAVPIPDDGSAVVAQGSITVNGAATSGGTIALFIGAQKILVPVLLSDSANAIATKISNAISAAVNLPITPSPSGAVVTVTAKWLGESGNQIKIYQDLDPGDALREPVGVTLTISQLASGATDPAVGPAFDALGAEFFTQIAFPYRSSAAIASLDAYWLARYAPEVKRPFLAILGYTGSRTDYAVAVAARNSAAETYVLVEDSPSPAFEVAASAVGVCARSAAANPARPWKTLLLPGIRAGDKPALTYAEHDSVQRAGGGTTDPQRDGTVVIHDLVTTYKLNALGAADDAWRYPETIANHQAKVYSLDNLFSGTPFSRGVVVKDGQPSGLSYAISPNRVKAFVRKLIDELWIAESWSTDRDAIMESLVVEIDAANPGRINVQITDHIAAGLRIIAILYQWGLGAAAA